MKEKTYRHECRGLPELKAAATGQCEGGGSSGCRSVFAEVRCEVELCLAKNGVHSDYLL